MKKLEKTPEEIAEQKLVKLINSTIRSLTTRIKNRCKDGGLMSVQMQFEFLRMNDTTLPEKLLTKEQTIGCFVEGIRLHIEGPLPKEDKKKRSKKAA